MHNSIEELHEVKLDKVLIAVACLRNGSGLERDTISIGLPFWLAGYCGAPEQVSEALTLGAAWVQVGGTTDASLPRADASQSQ
ncbi:MAG: hypothetical protein H6823_05200 [Planctomycetaceae bacterium]|nr:hypothetical protein [Planctomycetales bacterium]MCB9937616.1 hypothetical protein [Planctomycetaceae bacterium]